MNILVILFVYFTIGCGVAAWKSSPETIQGIDGLVIILFWLPLLAAASLLFCVGVIAGLAAYILEKLGV